MHNVEVPVELTSNQSRRKLHSTPRALVPQGLLPVTWKPETNKMMRDQIEALTEGFLSMATTLIGVQASGLLMQLEKFEPADNTACDWIKDYEEAVSISNWVDNTKKDQF